MQSPSTSPFTREGGRQLAALQQEKQQLAAALEECEAQERETQQQHQGEVNCSPTTVCAGALVVAAAVQLTRLRTEQEQQRRQTQELLLTQFVHARAALVGSIAGT